MTDIQKIIDILLPELIAQIKGDNSSEIVQKGLDNKEIPSKHSAKKGVHNGGK
ncbi:MAG: hypothetical protein NC218_04590 [Acetobacter sp.]|nr:hypothetical protein [Acetobacter sp.]